MTPPPSPSPHPDLRLRAATPDDTTAIQRLIGDIYAEYGFTLDLDDVDVHLNAPSAFFAERGGQLWVVEDAAAGGEVAATVAVKPLGDKLVELKSMYVHPRLRRRGVGSWLARVVEAWAADAGAAHVELWSDTRFENAHAMYRALGYTQRGERDLHDLNNTREYGFWKAISAR